MAGQTIPVFREMYLITKTLGDQQFGALMRAYFEYAETGAVYPGEDAVVDMAFRFGASQLDRYFQNQEVRSAMNRINGKKGGRPRKEPENPGVSTPSPENPGVFSETEKTLQSTPVPSTPIQSPPVQSPSGKHKNRDGFLPPTLEEVENYCRERGNQVDAQRFVSYYTANGWTMGKSNMKDWQAAVRSWERNGVEGPRQPGQPGQAQYQVGAAELEGIRRLERLKQEMAGET